MQRLTMPLTPDDIRALEAVEEARESLDDEADSELERLARAANIILRGVLDVLIEDFRDKIGKRH